MQSIFYDGTDRFAVIQCKHALKIICCCKLVPPDHYRISYVPISRAYTNWIVSFRSAKYYIYRKFFQQITLWGLVQFGGGVGRWGWVGIKSPTSQNPPQSLPIPLWRGLTEQALKGNNVRVSKICTDLIGWNSWPNFGIINCLQSSLWLDILISLYWWITPFPLYVWLCNIWPVIQI